MFLCVGKYIGHSRVHGNPVLDPCLRRDDENLKDPEKSSGDFSVYRAFQGDDNKHVCLFKLKALVLSCVFYFSVLKEVPALVKKHSTVGLALLL